MYKKILLSLIIASTIFIPYESFSESGKSILLKIGSKTAYVNFQPVTLDVAPIETKGRTLVPLRFIAEHFGAKKIEYYSDTEEILILLDDTSTLRDEIARLKNENESLRVKIRQLENQSGPIKQIQKPSQPQNLQCTLINDNVQLVWQPSLNGTYPIAGYRIYKDVICYHDYTRIATVPASATTFIDPDVIEGKTYTYYVTAVDSDSPPNESLESSSVRILISPIQNPNPPIEPTPNQYQLQFTFPDYSYPYNIKDVYIAEDSNYYYYRYTTYRSWKNATKFDVVTWIDKDQNIYTGLKTDSGSPIGYEYAVGFFYNGHGELIGAVLKTNEKNNQLELFYLFNKNEYRIDSNAINFAVSKSLFIPKHPFDYNIMITYDSDAHDTELYPQTTKLTYPKKSPSPLSKVQIQDLDSLKREYLPALPTVPFPR